MTPQRALKLLFVLWLLRKLYKLFASTARMHKYFSRLPAVPPSATEHPILGHVATEKMLKGRPMGLPALRDGFIGFVRQVLQENDKLRREGVMMMWFGNSKLCKTIPNTMGQVFVWGPSKLRILFAAKNQKYLAKGRSYRVSEDLIGQGVLASSGEKWSHQRSVLELGFKDDIIRDSVPSITETVMTCVRKFEKFADSGKTIDALEENLKLTMDVLGKFAFSYDFGSVDAKTSKDAPLYDSFTNVLEVLNVRSLFPPLEFLKGVPFLPTNRRFDEGISKIHAVVDDIITSRRQIRKKSDPIKDLLDIMLVSAGNETPMTDKEIGWNIATMLFAGHDTTAAQLTWLMYLLCTHQDVLDRVREEYEAVLGTDKDANPTFEQLETLKYLNAVLLEGLRLYPSAGFTKEILNDFDLEGHLLPKGTEVVIFPYLTHRDPDLYDKPNEFIPERWLDSALDSKGRNISFKSQVSIIGQSQPYFPFSGGVRNCVGRNLAVSELRIAVVKFFQRFDFTFVPNEKFSEDPSLCMTLNPAGILLKASKR